MNCDIFVEKEISMRLFIILAIITVSVTAQAQQSADSLTMQEHFHKGSKVMNHAGSAMLTSIISTTVGGGIGAAFISSDNLKPAGYIIGGIGVGTGLWSGIVAAAKFIEASNHFKKIELHSNSSTRLELQQRGAGAALTFRF